MKDFVIKDFERFVEIADTISTPFKFLQLTESDVGKDYMHLEAKVWMRTLTLKHAIAHGATQPSRRKAPSKTCDVTVTFPQGSIIAFQTLNL